jgi:hypothetical protein
MTRCIAASQPVIIRRGVGALIVVTISIVDDNIVLIDALLPVAMVGLLCIAAGECRCSNERNEPDLDAFGSFRHLSNGSDDDRGNSEQQRYLKLVSQARRAVRV